MNTWIALLIVTAPFGIAALIEWHINRSDARIRNSKRGDA
jgi:hypothetical protein